MTRTTGHQSLAVTGRVDKVTRRLLAWPDSEVRSVETRTDQEVVPLSVICWEVLEARGVLCDSSKVGGSHLCHDASSNSRRTGELWNLVFSSTSDSTTTNISSEDCAGNIKVTNDVDGARC